MIDKLSLAAWWSLLTQGLADFRLLENGSISDLHGFFNQSGEQYTRNVEMKGGKVVVEGSAAAKSSVELQIRQRDGSSGGKKGGKSQSASVSPARSRHRAGSQTPGGLASIAEGKESDDEGAAST